MLDVLCSSFFFFIDISARGGKYYPAKNGHFYFAFGTGTVEKCREKCFSIEAKLLEIRNDVQFEAAKGVFIEHFTGPKVIGKFTNIK